MINHSAHNLVSAAGLSKQAEDASLPLRGLYGALCESDNLRLAYEQIKDDPQNYGIDTATLETVEDRYIEDLLQKLSNDLQARTYQPTPPAPQAPATSVPERGRVIALRDLVVQAALKRLLEPVFPPAFLSDPQPEKTIKWLAGNIERGFSRVYAVNVEECLGAEQHKRLLARVRQRVDDPDLLRLLASMLAALPQLGHSQKGLLAPLLADIAFEGIDQILEQARALGREGNFLHVHCTRVANQLVILLDQDARYDWLLPAVQKRLREELSKLHYDLAAVETQSIDLTRGGALRFLGFELRLIKGRGGESRVHYRLLEEPPRRQPASPSTRQRRRWRFHPLRFARSCLSGMGCLPGLQLIPDAGHKLNAIQLGWRHLPIALCPILLLLFGWRSPLPWLCFALIFVCNWRWTLSIVRSAGGWTRRHKTETVLGACALAGLGCLAPVLSDIYANRSREEATFTRRPGFYVGQYNKAWPWDVKWIHYGLYVPPHFQKQKRLFPLIVFLHGYGERTENKIFEVGLPRAIITQFRPHSRNDRFEFVAFFPLDPTGQWQTGTAEVEGAMAALDYVIAQHRIDPARVYLTGLSNGANGVWRLAEAYPDKWAAVVPISSFLSPDVPKVRHIPAWIFHGAKDEWAPVKRERTLVQQLQEAQADVRYTEVADKDHFIWPEVYNDKELYNWLAQKVKVN